MTNVRTVSFLFLAPVSNQFKAELREMVRNRCQNRMGPSRFWLFSALDQSLCQGERYSSGNMSQPASHTTGSSYMGSSIIWIPLR